MAELGSDIPITILNVNGLKIPIERHGRNGLKT